MKPPSPVKGNVASILQDMSSSHPSFTQPPSSASTPFNTTSNVVSQMVSPTVSNSTTVITQSTSKSWPHNLSSHSQQLTAIPITTASSTNLSVFMGVSETPETYVSGHFKFSCESTASPDPDEEWDFLDDFKPLIPLPAEIALETDEEISDADSDEDWEVLDEFKSLIPLPSEIALGIGKYEKALFEDQAKLYKFVDQDWKEQNLCIVKILHHSFNGRVRLLMTSEEVLKACANHYITPDMEIQPLKNLKQAWTWVAQEFVNEELKPEHFCIRFKDAELAAAFKAAFIKAVNIAKGSITNNLSSSKVATTDSHVISKSFRIKFASTAEFWCCPLCETTNVADKHFCVICETLKPFPCRDSEVDIGAGKSFCSRECDIYSSFPMVYDIDLDKDSRINNLCSSRVPTTDSLVLSESCGLKLPSTETSWCCPLCETNNGADKHFCVNCETTKPFCSECNIYAMLSDDTLSSDDESCNN